MSEFGGPTQIAEYLQENGYNGRGGTARIREYSKILLEDLLEYNPQLAAMGENGSISYNLQTGFPSGASTVNLAIGPVQSEVDTEGEELGDFVIPNMQPDRVWAAIRIRNMMKQVGRNRNNRMSEMAAMAVEAHYNQEDVITGGLLVTSNSERVKYEHHNSEQTREGQSEEIETLVQEMPDIQRTHIEDFPRLDAVSVIVTDHDGLSAETTAVTAPPAPSEDSPVHYDNFLRAISGGFDERFLGRPDPLSAEPEDIVDMQESNALDFKSGLPPELTGLKKDVVGFLNSRGGIVVVGVDDDADVRPNRIVGLDDIEQDQGTVTQSLRKLLRPWPTEKIQFEPVEIDNEDILLIRVAESTQRLYDLEGRFHIRVGEANLSMQYEDIEQFVRSKIVSEYNLADLTR
jgi:hypothetical protein